MGDIDFKLGRRFRWCFEDGTYCLEGRTRYDFDMYSASGELMYSCRNKGNLFKRVFWPRLVIEDARGNTVCHILHPRSEVQSFVINLPNGIIASLSPEEDGSFDDEEGAYIIEKLGIRFEVSITEVEFISSADPANLHLAHLLAFCVCLYLRR